MPDIYTSLLAAVFVFQLVQCVLYMHYHTSKRKEKRHRELNEKSQIQILRHPGNEHIGWRQMGHKDIKEALDTPGLKIRLPNGVEELGKQ